MSNMDIIEIDQNFQWELTDEEKYGEIGLPKVWFEKLIFSYPFEPERDLHFSFKKKPILCLEVLDLFSALESVPAIKRKKGV